jgi:hypothetical protein
MANRGALNNGYQRFVAVQVDNGVMIATLEIKNVQIILVHNAHLVVTSNKLKGPLNSKSVRKYLIVLR